MIKVPTTRLTIAFAALGLTQLLGYPLLFYILLVLYVFTSLSDH